MIELRERIAGGMYGLLVGDALGVPYEFHPPEFLPGMNQIDMRPPDGFRRAHGAVKPGTWSDDGAQALCLLASLLTHREVDPEDFADQLIAWRETGYMAVDAQVFDVGMTTSQSIDRLMDRQQRGQLALYCGSSDPLQAGNGSLMRVLPLALWETRPDPVLMTGARWTSYVTHRTPKAAICCAVYCVWARLEMEGHPDAWNVAVDRCAQAYGQAGYRHPESALWLQMLADCTDPLMPTGGGYCVDTLQGARWVMERASNYQEAVRMAISLGHDTDTTAAVVGGIAGIRWGVSGIPGAWLMRLRGREICDPLIEKLLAVRCGPGAP